MAGNILYEPSSVRGDAGVLYLTKNQPCVIPMYFQIPIYDAQTNTSSEYAILPNDVVEFTIKSDLKLISNVITKRYNGIINNVAILRFSEGEMRLLLGNKQYFMSAKLYGQDGTLIRTLIKVLPIKIQEVV